MTREGLVTETFVLLADSLVADFDVIDLLTVLSDRCVELDLADSVGVLLVDSNNKLRVMAASTEQIRLLELFQLQNEEGPCLESFQTGKLVSHTDLLHATDRWPLFATESVDAGYKSVYALPLRLRNAVIGAMNLFRVESRVLPEADINLAQAFADVATIAVLQNQGARVAQSLTDQLQHALDSRVIIEQAKGMLSVTANIDMDEAFSRLRRHARHTNRQLTDVANDLVGGTLKPDDFLELNTPATP